MICKVFINTQPVIIIDDEYYVVDVFIPNIKLKKNVAYIIGEYVYVYKGKYNDQVNSPGIYKKDNEYKIIEPDDKYKHKFHIDNINELSTENIFDAIETDVSDFIHPDDIEIINNNSETFTPTIREEDDFLKLIIKEAILNKQINLKNYKGKFSNEYMLNNMKSGLSKSTKMTVPNFVKWCEILGLDWEMVIKDSGIDRMNPLTKTIRITNKH